MKKLLSLGILCASVIAAPLAAHATPLAPGSVPINFFVLDVTNIGTPGFGAGSDITSISWAGAATQNQGTGSLSPIGFNQNLTFGPTNTASGSVTFGVADGGVTPFTLTFPGLGTFTANTFVEEIGTGTASGATFLISGDFVPTGLLGDASNTSTASLEFALGYNGTYNGSADFLTPAVPFTPSVPEPSSLALLGTGILGVVGAARRRFKA